MVSLLVLFCFLSLVFFVVVRAHVLFRLLLLESCVILISLVILGVRDGFYVVIFLCVGACEAAVGLSLLINLVRATGSSELSLLY